MASMAFPNTLIPRRSGDIFKPIGPWRWRLKVEGRVALFSPLTPVLIDPAPRKGGKSGPRGAACHAQPHGERWLRPWATLVWPGERGGRLAACPSGISSPLCDVGSLQGPAEQRRRARGASRPRTHSEAPVRSRLTLCAHRALGSWSSEPFL